MKRSLRTAYLVLPVLAIIPFGFRTATWLSSAHKPIDPEMARAGEELFLHEWTPDDPLAAQGDGLGPVFNARSCVACHKQGGPGGGGPLANNVTTFTVRPNKPGEKPKQGVVHAMADSREFQETLAMVGIGLPHISQPTLSELLPQPGCDARSIHFPPGIHFSQRNTPALFGVKLIDEIPDRAIIANERRQRLKWGLAGSDTEDLPVGRALRLSDGRVGKFGWKAQTATLGEFVRAACANELGLGNPGQSQPAPLGRPDYRPAGLDLTDGQCRQLTDFVASLSQPIEQVPENPKQREAVQQGRQLFESIGCSDCHTPNLGNVQGLYSDLLLHRMGRDLEGGGSYNDPPLEAPEFVSGEGPQPGEWRTPPLWGLASSAPYMHDGRAATLQEAIELHAAQGARSAQRFGKLNSPQRTQLLEFLNTLQAP